MNLLVNFFKSNNDKRNEEYLFALNRNIDNEYIDTIFLFVEDVSHVEWTTRFLTSRIMIYQTCSYL